MAWHATCWWTFLKSELAGAKKRLGLNGDHAARTLPYVYTSPHPQRSAVKPVTGIACQVSLKGCGD